MSPAHGHPSPGSASTNTDTCTCAGTDVGTGGPARRTEADLVTLDAALAARHAAGGADDTAFVDADIALHTAVVAAAHNPVLDDLFTQFAPVLREQLVGLFDIRAEDPNQGYDSHAALVRAVRDGDPEAAGRVLAAELEATRSRLLAD
ncbi:FCD domain-containing protein [Kitasatospora sp. NPDC048545]|uniref:FadR/GntR family transcriptional regulator n=1 Tax=Kitasatospora sp. NPDC048545 TaxID=3157208 RepID=UPI0033D6DA19